jgi:hypothetical protein
MANLKLYPGTTRGDEVKEYGGRKRKTRMINGEE